MPPHSACSLRRPPSPPYAPHTPPAPHPTRTPHPQVGWSGDDIERLEAAGYVMSGSRHKRMNEVRQRKENQARAAGEGGSEEGRGSEGTGCALPAARRPRLARPHEHACFPLPAPTTPPTPPQVYSAEEKRALALFNYEEKAAREARLMAEFRAMLDAKAAAEGDGAGAPPGAQG